MADHISFAILRKAIGCRVQQSAEGTHYKLLSYGISSGSILLFRVIREQLGVTLHEDEAAFIALHIVNAELEYEHERDVSNHPAH